MIDADPLSSLHQHNTSHWLFLHHFRYCVASKGLVGWQSKWLWTLKDQIDRKFMYKYGKDLPDMSDKGDVTDPTNSIVGGASGASIVEEARMRCAGCGGKVQIFHK